MLIWSVCTVTVAHSWVAVHLSGRRRPAHFSKTCICDWSRVDFLGGHFTSEAASNDVPGRSLFRNITSSPWSFFRLSCEYTVDVLPQKIRLNPTPVEFLFFWSSRLVGLSLLSLFYSFFAHPAFGLDLLPMVGAQCIWCRTVMCGASVDQRLVKFFLRLLHTSGEGGHLSAIKTAGQRKRINGPLKL